MNAVVMDINFRKLCNLTDKLENQERFFDAFVHQSPVVMWCKDYTNGDGRMVFISEGHAEIFGIDPDFYQGRTDFDIFPYEVAEELRQQDLDVMANGTQTFPQIGENAFTNDPQWNRNMCIKFPIKTTDGRAVGVGGIAWPLNESG